VVLIPLTFSRLPWRWPRQLADAPLVKLHWRVVWFTGLPETLWKLHGWSTSSRWCTCPC
jgi:hypothetical protein